MNIYAPLEEMIRTINESADDEFADAVGKHLDLGLFMKYLAVESFMVEWDGIVGFVGMNNFDLYRFRQRPVAVPSQGQGRVAGVARRLDHVRLDTNVLVRRAMAVPALREAYLQRVAANASPSPTEPAADDPARLARAGSRTRRATLVTPADRRRPGVPLYVRRLSRP